MIVGSSPIQPGFFSQFRKIRDALLVKICHVFQQIDFSENERTLLFGLSFVGVLATLNTRKRHLLVFSVAMCILSLLRKKR